MKPGWIPPKPKLGKAFGEGHGWCYYFGHLGEMTGEHQ
jgi:hypothetical protein